jgi:glycosyltransferase involved in cell wall biosynthesis
MTDIRRVLLTADTVGGVWTYALTLSRELSRQGIAVGLATMGGRPDESQMAQTSAVPGLQLFESGYKLEWMDDPWEDVERAGRWLLEVARTFAPNIVHLNQFCFGALPFNAPALVVGHSCVLSWWRAVHGCDSPPEWSRYRCEVRKGLAGAALVAAPSEAMMRALQAHYGPLDRVAVIPNGAAASSGPPAEKEPFIFAAGRLWDKAKNLSLLDEVASGLPWPVVVAGDASDPAGRAITARNVRTLGKLTPEETERWMRRAAIYALPARYEPFGLSILEAALAGCALVLGDIPSLRELWNGAALFVPPGDPAALSTEIRRLIDDPAQRTAYAASALARASAFTTQLMAERYLAAYEAVVHRSQPSMGSLR